MKGQEAADKSQRRKFQLDMRKIIFIMRVVKYSNRSPRNTVESPFPLLLLLL